jgi:hypothetical protein
MTLCFRRWSRKGYAAFCSLGKQVMIGHVAKSIVDASLTKQKRNVISLTADGFMSSSYTINTTSEENFLYESLTLLERKMLEGFTLLIQPIQANIVRLSTYNHKQIAVPVFFNTANSFFNL